MTFGLFPFCVFAFHFCFYYFLCNGQFKNDIYRFYLDLTQFSLLHSSLSSFYLFPCLLVVFFIFFSIPLSQTSLRFLLHHRNNFCHMLHSSDYIILCCSMHFQDLNAHNIFFTIMSSSSTFRYFYLFHCINNV